MTAVKPNRKKSVFAQIKEKASNPLIFIKSKGWLILFINAFQLDMRNEINLGLRSFILANFNKPSSQ